MTPYPSGPGTGGRPGGPAAATPAGFIGRYQILEKIGEGGMGSLFLARDPAIDRLVALKLLRRGFDTPELRERFSREARAAGRLRHPNIVTIFDVGEHDGDPFIAMEFLAGETLDELVRHGARLSLVRRITLIEELCDGLAYAHRAGIVHRDIKPANLMVDSEGVLKILDFGIVRLDEGGATQSGMLVGTVNYMSPEQVNGSAIDHRSDIFAVGLVAYELLTSRQAFPGTLREGLFNRILNVAYEPMSKVAPEIDPEVAAIVEQALRADPADRYQDLARMRNDLHRARRRLEAAEDRAVEELGGDSGETMMVMAPAPTPAPGTAPKSSPALDAAEKALASGNYRAALTLAGRSAAARPRDETASAIMARAQAGLLERGRALQGSAANVQPSTGAPAPAGSGAVTPSGSVVPAPSGTMAAPHFSIALVAAAALLAIGLVVAAVLISSRSGSDPGEIAESTSTQGPATQASNPEPQAPASSAEPQAGGDRPDPPAPGGRGEATNAEVPPPASAEHSRAARSGAGSRQPEASDPPRKPVVEPARTTRKTDAPAASPPAPEPAAPSIVRVGRDGVQPPRRVAQVPPQYPASGQRLQGSVGVELTIGRDGRVTDARVTDSLAPAFDQAALAAVRRWEYAPTQIDGRPVAVIYPVEVTFTPPPEPARPAASDPPPASKPSPPAGAETRPVETKTAPPPRQPEQRDERAAIQALLKQYEAAWEARDADAIARVRQLSPAEAEGVRASLQNAERYTMELTVRNISVDPGGRRATVQCTTTVEFKPRGLRTERATTNSTLTLEQRGESWMIMSIR